MATSIIQRQQIHKTLMMIIFSIPIFISLNVFYKAINHKYFNGPEFPRTYPIIAANGVIQNKTYGSDGKHYIYVEGNRHWVLPKVYQDYKVGQKIQLVESYNSIDGWDFLQMFLTAITSLFAIVVIVVQIGSFFEWYGKWLRGEV